ncbi:MAG: peptidase S8, partial [bacterium]
MDHNTGNLTTTITNPGNIGFTGFADVTPGSGFIFKGTNFLFEGGLMVGTGAGKVSDAIRAGVSSEQDDDFKPISPLILTEGQVSDEFGRVVLDDAFAENPIGVEITQESFAYKEEPFTNFVIFKYTIKNVSGANLSNLWAGLFFDWDINTDANDFARFDSGKNLGYAMNNGSNPTQIAATKVLTSPGASSFRAINNPNEIFGGTGNDGFTASEKWTFLSSGIQRQTLDQTDVSTLTSTGPFTLNPDEKVEVAFAVIGASSATQLAL